MKRHSEELQREMLDRFDAGESATKIAKSLGLYTTSVTRVLKRNGRTMSDGKGINHSGWKGGRGIKRGYWTVYAPDHPRAMNTRRVWEHILVAEKKLGRPIDKKEHVHHINQNKLDNRPENLYVFESSSKHLSAHGQLDRVVGELIDRGIIKFRDGEYYV